MRDLTDIEIKEFLDEKYAKFNNPSFIELDPISIAHRFTEKNDIEIAGFLSATIAWGNRASILKSANMLLERMDNQPYDFIINASHTDFLVFQNFKYRTFNGLDCMFFLQSLQHIYLNLGGLGSVFQDCYCQTGRVKDSLSRFRNIFLAIKHPVRSEKHLANVNKNSAAKRLNMFLRWMVRKDNSGVDFGIWPKINPKDLFIPLDVHTSNVARKLGLLSRSQNDWVAVEELTTRLRSFDPEDPVKYDFALFGLGIMEKF